MARPRYEFRLLILLSITNGVVALERLSANFLSPYLVADLGLTNTQLGMLAGALSGTVAIGATLFGRLADSTGSRKTILLVATLCFSLVAGLPGLISGFGGLLLARMVLGFAEGPVVPLSQSLMSDVSDPARRGLNMGILQMAGAFLIGGTAGPVIATMVADAYGWRAAFSLSVIPGLIVVLALWLFVRPDPAAGVSRPEDHTQSSAVGSFVRLWKVRNVRLSILISGVFAAWAMIQNVFLPVYLTQVRGIAPATMGWIVGAGGVAGLVGGMGVPALSDLVGRRPVLIACGFLGIFAPAAILMLPNDPVLLGMAVMLGWMVVGISPLSIGVIPAESAPAGLIASAIGLTTAAGELFGGVIAPSVAGRLADSFGLATPFYLCIGLAVICGAVALLLQESRGGDRRKRRSDR
ncbi:MFS transporter [Sphingomonas sp. MMS24-J13]|uniref:MFS transporter n=1 Tax=Sphingomonas sp. MMS24-J13 TaxID=3238686 RepID=UPI00384F73FE